MLMSVTLTENRKLGEYHECGIADGFLITTETKTKRRPRTAGSVHRDPRRL